MCPPQLRVEFFTTSALDNIRTIVRVSYCSGITTWNQYASFLTDLRPHLVHLQEMFLLLKKVTCMWSKGCNPFDNNFGKETKWNGNFRDNSGKIENYCSICRFKFSEILIGTFHVEWIAPSESHHCKIRTPLCQTCCSIHGHRRSQPCPV